MIKETHADEGAVAGATREALSQIMPKAIGFNVGGKIGIARKDDHICVAIYFGVGLLHLDEVALGLDTGLCIPEAINPSITINKNG